MGESAGGYNIPVSLSSAAAATQQPDINEGTTVIFSSPFASVSTPGTYAPVATTPTTATSSAAEGNAGSSSSGSGVGVGGGSSTLEIVIAVGLALLVGLLVFVFRKKL